MTVTQTADFMDAVDGDVLWQLTGSRSGPTLLVTGRIEELTPAVARLTMLPSLVYLRGVLVVAGVEAACEADDVLSLDGLSADDVYWGILTRAAELGMISKAHFPVGMRRGLADGGKPPEV
ncbi:MAG: hypothetical protein ABJN34_03580 [Litoreibacter sp.]|uniref:hypothetical protein n=1 Tax=Litoreibacter sp. TaxID=1969459 RepID=UPI00329A5092